MPAYRGGPVAAGRPARPAPAPAPAPAPRAAAVYSRPEKTMVPPRAPSSPAYNQNVSHVARVIANRSPQQRIGGRNAPLPARQAPSLGSPQTVRQMLIAAIDKSAGNYSPAGSGLGPLIPLGRMSPALSKLEVLGQFNRDFQNLQQQGLLPKGAKQPPLSFIDRGMGRGGELSFEKGGRIFITPLSTEAATDPMSGVQAWGERTLLHELAHTLQSRRTLGSVPSREGGAQAYADAVTPRVLGPLPQNDTNYTGYTRQARARGPRWFMRGQFR